MAPAHKPLECTPEYKSFVYKPHPKYKPIKFVICPCISEILLYSLSGLFDEKFWQVSWGKQDSFFEGRNYIFLIWSRTIVTRLWKTIALLGNGDITPCLGYYQKYPHFASKICSKRVSVGHSAIRSPRFFYNQSCSFLNVKEP